MKVHYFVLGSDSYRYGLRRLLVDLGLDSNPFQHGFQNVPLNLVRSHFVAVGLNVTAVDYNYRSGLILLQRDGPRWSFDSQLQRDALRLGLL